ncbi:MAG: choice-of-anchor D domain-containing protein, partial [Acidobacteria bacterium]|nr:choice-of-anchor D domain-containing protein [Acidobacteriota bacterium]
MNRLTKMSFGIAVGLIVALASTLLPATASASQSGGVIAANPSSHDFGGVVEQVQSVTKLIEVRNDGSSNLVVNELKMIGQNAGEFHFTAQWPFTLPPGDQRQIVVSFDPSSTGPKEAVFRILSNASNQSQLDVPLRGNGLALAVLGHISAGPVLNNTTVYPGSLITVEVRVNMNGANPPAHLMQNYQASLSWNAAVLQFHGFTGGDSPWGGPASIGLSNSTLTWFDSVFNGVGGDLAIIRLKFRVVGQAGSSTSLNLGFSRMEGVDVENLLPILNVSSNRVDVVAEPTPQDIDVTPTFHDYGAVVLGSSASRTFVVRNTGMQNLIVSAMSLQGANPNQFSIVSGGGSFTLAAGQSRNVVVSYNPTSPGTKSAALTILSNDPDE